MQEVMDLIAVADGNERFPVRDSSEPVSRQLTGHAISPLEPVGEVGFENGNGELIVPPRP